METASQDRRIEDLAAMLRFQTQRLTHAGECEPGPRRRVMLASIRSVLESAADQLKVLEAATGRDR